MTDTICFVVDQILFCLSSISDIQAAFKVKP